MKSIKSLLAFLVVLVTAVHARAALLRVPLPPGANVLGAATNVKLGITGRRLRRTVARPKP